MRILSPGAHGVMDYLFATLLIASPWLFGFNHSGWETWIVDILGAAIIIYSIHTNYPAGLLKTIPYRTHLTIDVLGGILLAASPWIFGFADIVYLPHLVMGLAELAVVLVSEKEYHHRSVGTVD